VSRAKSRSVNENQPPPTTIADLLPNKQNPRKPWSPAQLEAFKASLLKFGDLGGIIRNRTTNQLIGGHKRIDAFRGGTEVAIEAVAQPIDRQGTVAHGYVLVDGARFGYREVEWSIEVETAANLAANRWAAEWDWQLVAEALQVIDSDELRTLTGFRDDELKNLMAADWTKAEAGSLLGDAEGNHAIQLTAAQYDLLTEAKARLDPTAAISDAGAIEALCRRLLATHV
jgi:hypothetical protein